MLSDNFVQVLKGSVEALFRSVQPIDFIRNLTKKKQIGF